MSLPKNITDVVFTIIDSSGPTTVSQHTLTIQNFTHPWKWVFWEGRKKMGLGGTYRRKKIIRGFDTSLEINWEDVRNQESDVVDFLNDLIVTKNNGYQIRFNVSGDTNYLYVVPESAVYSRSYTSQVIKRIRSTISFNIEQLEEDITYS